MLKLMTKGKIALDGFRKGEDGASLIEYTVLIGLITVAVVGIIGTVGGEIATKWGELPFAGGGDGDGTETTPG